ncbi:hypothetical protein F511_16384 [Dorcoceras hygrometricum]|uniref:Uncharacterized protein n=1 Tax=Dorcoceras hygrometricum TaxID=472368 RepID=A0A2Z7BB90_9LAMI|nr:hypothetical protein F511_16384 [Dorcoceras hygrometricum]
MVRNQCASRRHPACTTAAIGRPSLSLVARPAARKLRNQCAKSWQPAGHHEAANRGQHAGTARAYACGGGCAVMHGGAFAGFLKLFLRNRPRRLGYSIGYPRMRASGESSTMKHRLLHASGSHPIPPPNDPIPRSENSKTRFRRPKRRNLAEKRFRSTAKLLSLARWTVSEGVALVSCENMQAGSDVKKITNQMLNSRAVESDVEDKSS